MTFQPLKGIFRFLTNFWNTDLLIIYHYYQYQSRIINSEISVWIYFEESPLKMSISKHQFHHFNFKTQFSIYSEKAAESLRRRLVRNRIVARKRRWISFCMKNWSIQTLAKNLSISVDEQSISILVKDRWILNSVKTRSTGIWIKNCLESCFLRDTICISANNICCR